MAPAAVPAAVPLAAVAVVAVGVPAAAELARRLAAEGFTVVLLADELTAAEAGRVATEIQSATPPGRAAVFLGTDDLVAFVTELFAR